MYIGYLHRKKLVETFENYSGWGKEEIRRKKFQLFGSAACAQSVHVQNSEKCMAEEEENWKTVHYNLCTVLLSCFLWKRRSPNRSRDRSLCRLQWATTCGRPGWPVREKRLVFTSFDMLISVEGLQIFKVGMTIFSKKKYFFFGIFSFRSHFCENWNSIFVSLGKNTKQIWNMFVSTPTFCTSWYQIGCPTKIWFILPHQEQPLLSSSCKQVQLVY